MRDRLADSLFVLDEISGAIHQLNQRAEKNFGLSLVQWNCLKRLVDLPASSADALAKALDLHPSSLTQTLKRLEKKNFLHLGDDPSDSRRRLISITREGKQALDRLSRGLERDGRALEDLYSELVQIREALFLINGPSEGRGEDALAFASSPRGPAHSS